jgi:hypothetical protein
MLLAAALSSLLLALFILAPVARPWRQSLLQRAGLVTATNPSGIAGKDLDRYRRRTCPCSAPFQWMTE